MKELFLELTEDQFDDRFPLRPNHLDASAGWAFGDGPGCLFAPHADELIWVCTHNTRYIWTLVDGDDGDMYILSGYHLVNRVGYFLSVNPIPLNLSIQVHIPMSHEPDEE